MYKNTCKGFTLVEMVLYVALCSILLLSLSTFLSFLLQSRVKSQSIAEVNQQGFQMMQFMTQAIRNGKTVTSPLDASTSTTLSITTAVPLLSPVVFSASGTSLMIQEGSGKQVKLTNSRVAVSSLVFQNISTATNTEKTVKISFVLSYTSSSTKQEYVYSKLFQSSATLRK
jgi:type II secretory pathway pseudopilin PulG